MYLRKVEAIEIPGGTQNWNRFWWEEKINGETYQKIQDTFTDNSYFTSAIQYMQDLFTKKRKELKNQA